MEKKSVDIILSLVQIIKIEAQITMSWIIKFL